MKTIITLSTLLGISLTVSLSSCEKSPEQAAPITGSTHSYQIVKDGQYLGELMVTDNGGELVFQTMTASETAQITRFNVYSTHCDSLRTDTSAVPQTPIFTWQDSFTRETATETLAFGSDQRCLCVLPIIVNNVRHADTQTSLSLAADNVGEPIRYCR